MLLETGHCKGLVDYVAVYSKADDYDLFKELYRQRKMNLITSCRQNMDRSENRQAMRQIMNQAKFKQIYKERAYRVEPMQGLVKEIFDLNRCWMKGTENNRWLFAAMGLTIQMHQLKAYHEKRST